MKDVTQYDHTTQLKAIRDTLYIIGGKWSIPIINSICNGNKRFKEIERSIPGLNKRMLSSELRKLEINGLITRSSNPLVPNAIHYEETDYGATLADIISELIVWGVTHRKRIF